MPKKVKKSRSSRKKPKTVKRSSSKKPKKVKIRKVKKVSRPKTRLKPSPKPSAKKNTRPVAETIPTQTRNEDILEKFSKEVGYNYSKPKSLSDFDKHLEETARLISGKDPVDPHKLPEFSEDHIQQVKQVPEKVAPQPEHASMTATHSHPYTEHATSTSSMWDMHPEHHTPVHHRHAINAIVLAFFGVLVPLLSIVALYVSLKAVRKGSHTGKGAALLSIATLLINLMLIYLFYTKILFPTL